MKWSRYIIRQLHPAVAAVRAGKKARVDGAGEDHVVVVGVEGNEGWLAVALATSEVRWSLRSCILESAAAGHQRVERNILLPGGTAVIGKYHSSWARQVCRVEPIGVVRVHGEYAHRCES